MRNSGKPGHRYHDLTEFDAVIVASALYANRWHRDARRFVRRNTAALCRLPVWLASSGPLDDSAKQRDIPPTRWGPAPNRIGARGHVTFGGRLSPDARGFPASAMAKTHAGDWRDETHIQRWVESSVAELNPGGCGFLSPSRGGRLRARRLRQSSRVLGTDDDHFDLSVLQSALFCDRQIITGIPE